MTTPTPLHSSTSRSTRFRRLAIRSTCASATVLIAWSVSAGSVTLAAPPTAVQAPSVQASFAGLRLGSQGGDVTALQNALIAAGMNVPGGDDGVFGSGTAQAVIDFQNGRGLPATGEVDQATAEALAPSSVPGSDTSTSTSADAGLAEGARGPAVVALQNALVAKGVYLAGGADGVYGSLTTRAVRQFQGWNGLPPTGSVTARTAQLLGLSGGAASGGATPAPAPAPATPSASTSFVGLARGARGDNVKQLQVALQGTGLVVRGGADGVFGAGTESSLKLFQRVNGIAETGVLTERGAGILGLGTGGAAATPSSTPASSSYLGLAVGARGAAVKDVQAALLAAGVRVRGGADGVFGTVTKTALLSYQSAVGAPADGTVNQATIDNLRPGSGQGPVPFAGGTPAGGTPTATPPSTNSYVGLAIGARGDKVAELQKALQSTGLVVRGGADGVFGGATKTALMAFQKVNGIAQTGVTTERGVAILGLGSGGAQGVANPGSGGGAVQLVRFPAQGRCFFGDTWGAARAAGRRHEGVDIIAKEGNLLYAVVDGTISKQYWDQPGALSGNGLRVAQADGTYFTYLHMSGFAPGIAVGTKVKAGDVIGFVGNTGSSATAHLHFEVHPGGGAAVNPYPYVKAIDDCSNANPQYQSSFS